MVSAGRLCADFLKIFPVYRLSCCTVCRHCTSALFHGCQNAAQLCALAARCRLCAHRLFPRKQYTPCYVSPCAEKRPDSGTDLLGHDNRRYCGKQHYSGTGFFDSGHGQSSDHFDLQPRLPRGSGHPCTDRRPHYYHQFRGRSAVWQN